MIPLPGLVLLIWLLRVCCGLLLVSAAVCILAVRIAHRSWRAKESGAAGERLAVIMLVPGLICFVFFLPPFDPRVFVLSSLPALVSLGALSYIRNGNRQRGLPSLGLRQTVRIALASLAGSVLLLVATSIGIRAHQARMRQMEEEARARGQANQDSFAALLITDRGVTVAGVTSTPPALDDDGWVLALDGSLAVQQLYAPGAPKRQALFALAADDSGLIAAGHDDGRPLWLRLNNLGGSAARKVWNWGGDIYALATLGRGATLAVGERDGSPFVARLDASGAEQWSTSPDLKASLHAVVTDGRRYLAAGSEDVPFIPDSSTVLVGGTTDGGASWAKRFLSSEFLPTPHALAVTKGGAVLVLGTTKDLPGRMRDLWLARISEDGVLLDERTFGSPFDDMAGGLAVRGRHVFVAGYRFIPLQEELWLLEFDESGNEIWGKTYAAASHGRPAALAVTREGNLLLAGYREGADLHRDGWVAVFDSTGTLIAQRTYP